MVIHASIAGLVIVAAITMSLIGARLPQRHQVSRAVVLQATPADVYGIITDRANAPSWRKDLKSVEMLGLRDGRLRFREHGSHGIVTYEVVEDVPGQSVVTRIVDRDLGYTGSWTYALSSSDGGTVLTITEKGDVSNVFFRFMARYVFGHSRTIDTYLAALSKHLTKS